MKKTGTHHTMAACIPLYIYFIIKLSVSGFKPPWIIITANVASNRRISNSV